MKSTLFIAELSKECQKKIKALVNDYLIDNEYENVAEIIDNVMNDRLCNIEEIIDIEPFLNTGKVISIER